MRIIRNSLLIAAILVTQPVFAGDDQDSWSKNSPCDVIAKSCLNAGYDRSDNSNKRFWQDCMKPLLLGKTAEGVTVDSDTVKKCRTDKIDSMKKELKEFQNVSSK